MLNRLLVKGSKPKTCAVEQWQMNQRGHTIARGERGYFTCSTSSATFVSSASGQAPIQHWIHTAPFPLPAYWKKVRHFLIRMSAIVSECRGVIHLNKRKCAVGKGKCWNGKRTCASHENIASNAGKRLCSFYIVVLVALALARKLQPTYLYCWSRHNTFTKQL